MAKINIFMYPKDLALQYFPGLSFLQTTEIDFLQFHLHHQVLSQDPNPKEFSLYSKMPLKISFA